MKKNNRTDTPGLIVPIDVVALCVGKNSPAIFEPAPYNFSLLPGAGDTEIPNISEKVMTGGQVNMAEGIHLHWALPDAVTRGVDEDRTGKMVFPDAADRWLITRVFTDVSVPGKPLNKIKSWVLESNFHSPTKPDMRESITVPFRIPTDDPGQKPFRYLGRVCTFEEWAAEEFVKIRADGSGFIDHLSAVGYGIPEFSAFYHTCKSVLGFYDTAADLAELGLAGQDKIVSYHVIGWYSLPGNDPLHQVPGQFTVAAFDKLAAQVTDAGDKAFLNQAYPVAEKTGRRILRPGLDDDARQRLWAILYGAGYDFLSALLAAYKWALPSGAKIPSPGPDHTLFTGMIQAITWNENKDYFGPIKSDINIAVGNTPAEALAALIANKTDLKGQPAVELILDALQLGLLARVNDVGTLDQWEDLKLAIQQSGFSSTDGGDIWEIKEKTDGPADTGEETLPDSLAEDLNNLNIYQQEYDKAQYDIGSMRWQIFSDWYRFMQIFHRGEHDPDHGLDATDIAYYIMDRMTELNDKISQTTTGRIDRQIEKIDTQLGKTYELKKVSAPRYWQPNDPVVLFQGEGIDPPDRYGGDGRFMADDTMVCRLSDQVMRYLTVAPQVLGNPSTLVLNAGNLPQLPSPGNLPFPDEMKALLTESSLLNAGILAVAAILSGAGGDFTGLVKKIQPAISAFLLPAIPKQLTADQFQSITQAIAAGDRVYFQGMYKKEGDHYVLSPDIDQLTGDDIKRLDYILISTAWNPTGGFTFSGPAPSPIAVEQWQGTPWLPFSLKWSVYYYPFANIDTGDDSEADYPADFITANFTLDNGNLKYTGPKPDFKNVQTYSNAIFLTPFATYNFKKQLLDFIGRHPDDPLDPELKEIAEKIGDIGVLSQALSGFDDVLMMRLKEMQLQVGDPSPGGFNDFSNTQVKGAVAQMNTAAPCPGNNYNPIRAGLMKIASLKIVDVFGRNINLTTPNMIYRAVDLKQDDLSLSDIYLPPRLTQPSRLLFRWLSAGDDLVEMNTHPASTPICGWVLCNHLDSSLWLYDNLGTAYGSLILNYDRSKTIWQCAPGSDYFGEDIHTFFDQIPHPNPHLKAFSLALFDNGPAFLDAFMRALDKASATIAPAGFRQSPSNAVLMGKPLALVRASLKLELQGLPVFNQSWLDFRKEVNSPTPVPRCDNAFTKVAFPVRLGAVPQVDDGLVGYFKEDDYRTFYAPVVKNPQKGVVPPAADTITLTGDPQAEGVKVSLLVEPRGEVHASTGVLPIKAIDIPPDQYAQALTALKLAFLTSPLVCSQSGIAFPVPAESGGAWSFVENEKTGWQETSSIGQVNDRATMGYSPQQVLEGWLKLADFKALKKSSRQ